jgi:predicted RNase H-like HicB family nuclease
VALLSIRRERIVHRFQRWVAEMADMGVKVETEVEDDAGWNAEVVDMAGAMAYGATENQAIDAARVLALEVMAEKIGEPGNSPSRA